MWKAQSSRVADGKQEASAPLTASLSSVIMTAGEDAPKNDRVGSMDFHNSNPISMQSKCSSGYYTSTHPAAI